MVGLRCISCDQDADLENLVGHIPVVVDLIPGSGTNPSHDYWTAQIYELSLACTDLGADAALLGLASEVAVEVPDLLADRLTEGGPLVGLLLRLYLAQRNGSLRRLIVDAARLTGCDHPPPS